MRQEAIFLDLEQLLAKRTKGWLFKKSESIGIDQRAELSIS
jgi:hypothetical protein